MYLSFCKDKTYNVKSTTNENVSIPIIIRNYNPLNCDYINDRFTRININIYKNQYIIEDNLFNIIEKVLKNLKKNYDCNYCSKNYTRYHSCVCEFEDDDRYCNHPDCVCINCISTHDKYIILNQSDEEKNNCTCTYYYDDNSLEKMSNKEYYFICDIISFFSKKEDNKLANLTHFGNEYVKKLFDNFAYGKKEMDIYSDISKNIKPFIMSFEYQTIEDHVVELKKKLNKEINSYDMSLCGRNLLTWQVSKLVEERNYDNEQSNNKPYFVLRQVISRKNK